MSGQELRQAALMAKKVRSEEGVLFLALALPFPLSSKAESAWLWVSQRMRRKNGKGREMKLSTAVFLFLKPEPQSTGKSPVVQTGMQRWWRGRRRGKMGADTLPPSSSSSFFT